MLRLDQANHAVLLVSVSLVLWVLRTISVPHCHMQLSHHILAYLLQVIKDSIFILVHLFYLFKLIKYFLVKVFEENCEACTVLTIWR